MPERFDRPPGAEREPGAKEKIETSAEAPEAGTVETERAAAKGELESAESAAAKVAADIAAARTEFEGDAQAEEDLDALFTQSERATERMAEIAAELERSERIADLNAAVVEGTQAAIDLLRSRFEDTKDEKDRLPFHGADHSVGVAVRTRKILEAIERGAPELVDERTVEIGQLAAIFHDSVQVWEPNTVQDGEFTKVLRKRLASPADAKASMGSEGYIGNEAASAAEAVGFFDRYNEQRRADGLPEVFTEEDKEVVRRAIDATIPGFDPEKGTVVQPRLVKESAVITRAVALADLGEAGMNPEGYLEGGDALFREENLDVLDAAKDPSSLSEAQKDYMRKRMLGWSKFQPKFAAGRKARLEQELEGLPEAAAAEVRKLFDKFDETVAAASAVAARRETMSFEEMLRDMGYGEGEEEPQSAVA